VAFKNESTRTYSNRNRIFIRHIGVRLSERLADSLIEYAESVGKPPSVIARIAIGEYLSKRKGMKIHGDVVIPWIVSDD
jgi:hypothetical protein